jgi:hypothetical protein
MIEEKNAAIAKLTASMEILQVSLNALLKKYKFGTDQVKTKLTKNFLIFLYKETSLGNDFAPHPLHICCY